MSSHSTTVALLGSTGSIGTQTLDVVAAEPDRFRIVALAAGSDVTTLAEQARQVRPELVVVASGQDASAVEPLGRQVLQTGT